MKKTKPEILIDCDGVMANIGQAVVDLIAEKLQLYFCVDDIKKHEIFDSLGIPEYEYIWDDAITNEQNCLNIPVYHEAKIAIDELRTFADVYCVTSPHKTSPWMHEREQWLKEKMGFTKKRIIHTSAKYMIPGDMFIDDFQDNIESWKERHIDKTAVLFATNYNCETSSAIRTNDWNEIIKLAKAIKL